MPSSIVYLDESGDLGWKFDAPYRHGGSSRYLTISAICLPPEKAHLPNRVVKDLYETFKWGTKKEHKWSGMSSTPKAQFAKAALTLCAAHNDIFIHAIVVKKENVQAHIREDSNKLYNYMIRRALLDRMTRYDVVTMIPDARSVKVQSGNSLGDYLQTELWFTKKSTTKLVMLPTDSEQSQGLQFADMLAGAIQGRFEDNRSAEFQVLRPKLLLTQLFF